MCHLVCLALVLFSLKAWSEEVDDFVKDKSKMPPSSSAEIDRLVNDQLAAFVERSNASDNPSCDRKALGKNFRYFFDKNFSNVGNKLRSMSDPQKGAMIQVMFPEQSSKKQADYQIEFFGPDSKKNSVYEGTEVRGCCVSALNVEGIPIGLDKVDHMFGNGGLLWEKWEAMSEDQRNIDTILKLSTNQEDGGWGLAGSRIKSYGDLAANWSGFNFYREVFDGPDPYYVCKGGHLKLKRKFKIADYIKKSWSEASNCPAFPSAETAQKWSQNLAKRGMTCPLVKEDCEEIVNLYKDQPEVVRNIVSPVCKGRKPDESVETPRSMNWTEMVDAVGGLGDMVGDKVKKIKVIGTEGAAQ